MLQRLSGVFAMAALAAGPVALADLPAKPRVPVLVELFTSEGCSSCPPADRLLESLDRDQPVSGAEIIVLSEHVDYWDEGGWKDPFSSPEFTRRQQTYVRQFRLDSAYTPQMVVDGQAEFVGGDAARARESISKATRQSKTPLQLEVVERGASHVTVRVGVESKASSEATLLVALAESHVESNVSGGENSKRQLRHVAAARSLVTAGTLKAGDSLSRQVNLDIPRSAGKGGLRVVAFLQDRASGRLLGVRQLEL